MVVVYFVVVCLHVVYMMVKLMIQNTVRSFGSKARQNFMKFSQTPDKAPRHARLVKNLPSTMAVFVPFVDDGGHGQVLVTKRSSLLRSHRGEVCFPGGKSDKGESLEQTALRETHEEIGIDTSDIEIWGSLPPVLTRQLTSTVTPLVGLVKQDLATKELVVNIDEVHLVFSLPVEELCQSVAYTQFKSKKVRYKLPVFRSNNYKILYQASNENFNGELRVWGLSAVMLHQALSAVCPEYSPQLEVAFY